jgi:hypothetical protein
MTRWFFLLTKYDDNFNMKMGFQCAINGGKMKAKRLCLSLLIVFSSLFAVTSAKAEYVDVDDGINSVYTNDDYYGNRHDHRRQECRKERRVVYEYDHDGYYRPVTKKVKICYTRSYNRRHMRRRYPIYNENDRFNRRNDGNGNIQIRLGF